MNINPAPAVAAVDPVIAKTPIAYRIEDVPTVSGLSRTRVFDAIRTKKLMARKAGRQTIIEDDELRRFIQSLPTRGSALEAAA